MASRGPGFRSGRRVAQFLAGIVPVAWVGASGSSYLWRVKPYRWEMSATEGINRASGPTAAAKPAKTLRAYLQPEKQELERRLAEINVALSGKSLPAQSRRPNRGKVGANVSKPRPKRDRIISDSTICNGRPIIAGTRITAQTVLEFLAAGDSAQEVLDEYPNLTRADVLACLEYAARLLGNPIERLVIS